MGSLYQQCATRGELIQCGGPEPPAEFCNLRESAAQSVLAAHGINSALLLGKSDGTLAREMWRQLLHGTLRPVARMIGDELTDKLDLGEPPIFNFTALYASDLSGRASSAAKLAGIEGMTADMALQIAGLMHTEPA